MLLKYCCCRTGNTINSNNFTHGIDHVVELKFKDGDIIKPKIKCGNHHELKYGYSVPGERMAVLSEIVLDKTYKIRLFMNNSWILTDGEDFYTTLNGFNPTKKVDIEQANRYAIWYASGKRDGIKEGRIEIQNELKNVLNVS